MIIDDERKSLGTKSVGDMTDSDVFPYDGDYFMATDECRFGKRVCVRLRDGFLVNFERDGEYEVVRARMVIE